ncbi:hypothetical protein ACTJKK_13325 [Microbacterium sp. 22179]|uniref:hypothetical protein n=1 Tax=Microbacterium sp. 22179 TaxID=3453886 RepID=UPI003F837A75
MTRRRRRIRKRPYRTPGLWLIWIGSLLILASIPQFFFGIPVSDGFAPAGLSLGPLTLIAGVILYFSQRPGRGDGTFDDSATFRWTDISQP